MIGKEDQGSSRLEKRKLMTKQAVFSLDRVVEQREKRQNKAVLNLFIISLSQFIVERERFNETKQNYKQNAKKIKRKHLIQFDTF